MRFLLDEGLSPRVGALLRAAGHDTIHTRDVGLANLDQFEEDIAKGALVVIGDGRLRIRSLPI